MKTLLARTGLQFATAKVQIDIQYLLSLQLLHMNIIGPNYILPGSSVINVFSLSSKAAM